VKNTMDLLTIGDVSIDLFMKVEDKELLSSAQNGEMPNICFPHGSKIPVSHFETSIAGNSLNVGVGCKYLGLKTALYTEMGDDDNAKRVVSELEGLGVGTQYCATNKGTPTNVHTVIVCGGDRTIFSYHEPRHYKIQNWENPKWVYYTSLGYGFEAFQQELIGYLQKNKNIGVAFNPGTIQMKAGIDKLKSFIQVTDILFLNLEEAQRLVEGKDLPDLHKKLHQLGAKMTVITDGKKGASASDGKEVIVISAYSDERPVVDKTGAGDAFSSGFLAAIFYGKGMKEALTWGAVNSGDSIKEIGAIKGLCTKEQIEKKVRELMK
jgi:ribokinase